MTKKILIASDHAGFQLKKSLMMLNPQLPWEDLGTFDETSVDYPDYTDRLVEKMPKTKTNDGIVGVLICGSGQGMVIRANRFSHIRAALCWTPEVAQLSRAHNDANVLCLGSKFVTPELAKEILNVFLTTPFEGGRHERRVSKLS